MPQDFVLITEVKITAKPVTPKTGLTQRGPYERNQFVATESVKSFYYGDKGDIATLASNAVLVPSRQWALSSNDPAQGYAIEPINTGSTSALLRGMVHDHGVSTVVTFEYGTTTALGTSATATQSPLSGDAYTLVSKAVSGLTEGTQYYYRVKMVSGGVTVYSAVKSFVAGSGPTPTPSPTPTSTE